MILSHETLTTVLYGVSTRNVAEVGRDCTAAILRATNFGVDTYEGEVFRIMFVLIRVFRELDRYGLARVSN